MAALAQVAAAAPPFNAVGLECRLAEDDWQLDFQLGTRRAECDSVVRFFERRYDDLSPAWERVFSFCREWSTPGTRLHGGVAELWCELDVDLQGDEPTLNQLVPSVFVAFEPLARDLRSTVESVLETFAPEQSVERAQDVLACCTAACPPGARVSHLGVMLGRSVAGLRVHVTGVRPPEVERFLTDVGWQGDASAVSATTRLLLDHGDQAVLCLNVVDGVLPGIGIECFFDQKRGIDPRWRPLFGHLASVGLASAERVEALVRWPIVLTPADVPWPEDLIVRSLTQPATVFGVIERRLSHVKLALDHDGHTTAKAYFGAGHVWQRPRDAAKTQRPSPPTRPAASVADAAEAALMFLLRARNQGGWWRDFFDRGRPADIEHRITGYASDEWVTAYIASMLATVDREAAVEALELLLARHRDGDGWGYHALLPADADTTTWVLRLADSVDARSHPRLVHGRAFVGGLVGSSGGVATYPREAAGALETFLQLPGPYDGWCAEHVCVTAAASGASISVPHRLASSLAPSVSTAPGADTGGTTTSTRLCVRSNRSVATRRTCRRCDVGRAGQPHDSTASCRRLQGHWARRPQSREASDAPRHKRCACSSPNSERTEAGARRPACGYRRLLPSTLWPSRRRRSATSTTMRHSPPRRSWLPWPEPRRRRAPSEAPSRHDAPREALRRSGRSRPVRRPQARGRAHLRSEFAQLGSKRVVLARETDKLERIAIHGSQP